ncbi:MAG: hypothetical protein ACI8T1_002510 [Verrucomicrobiales bacterium]|jgi:hypothetical protein
MNSLPNSVLSRRAMLRRMSAGFGSVSLAGLLPQVQASNNPAVLGKQNLPGRAKRVIFLFMNGGPSHLDTFDPKPALARHAGEQPSGELYKKSKGSGLMPSPLQFHRSGKSGVEVSESLPYLSKVIDDCCIIRSMHTDVPNHEPALLMMQSGHLQPTRPSLGAWAVYGLGNENENLPGYVVLRPGKRIVVGPALWSSGFLPAQYQASTVPTTDMRIEHLLKNIKNSRYGNAEQRAHLDLLAEMNREHLKVRDGDAELEAQIRSMETAYNMQAEASEVFDVSREPVAVRKLYGDSPYANSCLLARRLIENGVRFVSVYYTKDNSTQPWDTHSKHDKGHAELCRGSDQASAALIQDLKLRGLLEDTLVVWTGEFGRTPYAQDDKNGAGRDHHHTAFSTLLAGGGVKGGYVHGATDEFGMHAVQDKVHVHDLHATMLHLLGIDHEELTYRYSGRDYRLTDVHGKVVHNILA